MFCTMNINDCYTANTPGEYLLWGGVGKDMREALDSLLICGNKIDPEGPGKLLFVTLGYANLATLCLLLQCVCLTGVFFFLARYRFKQPVGRKGLRKSHMNSVSECINLETSVE